MVWRRGRLPEPPAPFPSRIDAFLTACAIHAGHRERDARDLLEGVTGFAEAMLKR